MWSNGINYQDNYKTDQEQFLKYSSWLTVEYRIGCKYISFTIFFNERVWIKLFRSFFHFKKFWWSFFSIFRENFPFSLFYHCKYFQSTIDCSINACYTGRSRMRSKSWCRYRIAKYAYTYVRNKRFWSVMWLLVSWCSRRFRSSFLFVMKNSEMWWCIKLILLHINGSTRHTDDNKWRVVYTNLLTLRVSLGKDEKHVRSSSKFWFLPAV